MLVEIGHSSGLESQETDQGTFYAPVDGERTTTFKIPDGISISEAVASVKDAIGYHIAEGGKPVWVKADHKDLEWALADYFEIDRRANRRPVNWGQGAAA